MQINTGIHNCACAHTHTYMHTHTLTHTHNFHLSHYSTDTYPLKSCPGNPYGCSPPLCQITKPGNERPCQASRWCSRTCLPAACPGLAALWSVQFSPGVTVDPLQCSVLWWIWGAACQELLRAVPWAGKGPMAVWRVQPLLAWENSSTRSCGHGGT